MRLIDADALAKWLDKNHHVDKPTGKCDERQNRVLGIAISALKNPQITPTIDAVPVVRCKDCKHRYTGTCEMICDSYEWTADDGFCNAGERWEDNG